MRSSINKILLASILSISFAIADDGSFDSLLKDIKQKTDLSDKTKLENGGISYIYTREDLQKMQVYTLQDILKTTYPFGYTENQYGIVDPYTTNPSMPYMSSSIKIYIDNQELTTGIYGSGLSVYGNMNIDFVDHIEVYSGNPTFELSTEPAFTIIRLFSKTAMKDTGKKVKLVTGIDGENGISVYQTDTLENSWSYFAFASYLDNKRTKYKNENVTLSRDTKDTQLLATIKKDNQNILFSGVISEKDTFMGGSLFGTPNRADLKGEYIHIGYDAKFDSISFLASYDSYNNEVFMDDNTSNTTLNNFNTDMDADVYTLGLTYNIQNNKNTMLSGVKYRYKYFKYNHYIVDGQDRVDNPQYSYKFDHDTQTTATAFMENQYSVEENKIITTGLSLSKVNNNHSVQNNNLFAYRLGYTFTNKKWVSKTIASYLETTLDPYLVNNDTYLNQPTINTKKEKKNVYMQNIKYKHKADQVELVASYVSLKDSLMPDANGKLSSLEERLDVKSILLRYTKEYNDYDKIEISVGHNNVTNIPLIGNLKEKTMVLRSFNVYKKFDFYNELLFYKNNYNEKESYDYGIAVSYHHTDDLIISLKGINLLDRSNAMRYTLADIHTVTKIVDIPSIDKKVLLAIEYTF